jgi:hypothetical protein
MFSSGRHAPSRGPCGEHLLQLPDERQGVAEVGQERVFGGKGVLAGADLHGAVAAGGADELLDRPAGAVLDEPGHGQGGEDDGQVGFDGVPFAVVDRPGPVWRASEVTTAPARSSGPMRRSIFQQRASYPRRRYGEEAPLVDVRGWPERQRASDTRNSVDFHEYPSQTTAPHTSAWWTSGRSPWVVIAAWPHPYSRYPRNTFAFLWGFVR